MIEKFLTLAVSYLSAIALFADILNGEIEDTIFLTEKF